MELPIYQENLRSSGDWRSGLNQARAIWEQVQARPDTIARLRALQMQLLGSEASIAAQLISEWAARPEIEFSVPQLLELNRKLTTNETLFRETEVTPINEAHDPPLARMLPRLLDNAMGWFATEGFAEMNAVEQAALVHLRLLDLQPFAAANLTTAILAASFYTERAGLPPLLFDPQETRYAAALESAFRMLTQHLVDYFAESLTKTISNLKSQS
ncbi:MAG: Fic family protein [Acidobacteria bacterium]|nr:Fic family protein [Acidobacteriota bacterium]